MKFESKYNFPGPDLVDMALPTWWILWSTGWSWYRKFYYNHYCDVIMGAMAFQFPSLTIVYSTVYSDADQRKIKAPRHWPLCGKFTDDRWIPRTKASNAENVSIWWRHHAVKPVDFTLQTMPGQYHCNPVFPFELRISISSHYYCEVASL